MKILENFPKSMRSSILLFLVFSLLGFLNPITNQVVSYTYAETPDVEDPVEILEPVENPEPTEEKDEPETSPETLEVPEAQEPETEIVPEVFETPVLQALRGIKKVEICHFPQDEFDKKGQILEVAMSAVLGHIPNHDGDFLIKSQRDRDRCLGIDEEPQDHETPCEGPKCDEPCEGPKCDEPCEEPRCGDDTPAQIKIVARQVICDAEMYLPNMSGGADITATTAQDWVDQSEGHCWLQPYRFFEWAYGDISNPGDETQYGDEDWNTTKATGLDGKVKTTITFDSKRDVPKKLWFRQVFEENDYDYTHGDDVGDSTDSAELYCHTDVLNYDNFDFINNIEQGAKYQCVGFQVGEHPTDMCLARQEGNIVGNGGFESEDVPGAWALFQNNELDSWKVEWMPDSGDGPAVLEIQESVSNWLSAQGIQHAELGTHWLEGSGPSAVKISQKLDTIPGATYNVLYQASARPNVSADDNILGMKVKRPNASDISETHELGSGNSMDWQVYEYSFVASAPKTTLVFKDLGTANTLGPLLDDVQVSCEPLEPSNPETDDPDEPFVRSAEITSPLANEEVSGFVSFDATLYDEDGDDSVQWAVRLGTCAASTGTVFGNVDGFNDSFTWDGMNFSAITDVSSWDTGEYCFVFNPTESAGDDPIRETQEFTIVLEEQDPDPEEPDPDLEEEEEDKKGSKRNVSFGANPQVLGAETEFGQCPYFTEYMKRGDYDGDGDTSQVRILQEFLSSHLGINLAEDGYFGKETERAMHTFQQKYFDEIINPWGLSGRTTGWFYKTSRVKANEIMGCNDKVFLEDPQIWYSLLEE